MLKYKYLLTNASVIFSSIDSLSEQNSFPSSLSFDHSFRILWNRHSFGSFISDISSHDCKEDKFPPADSNHDKYLKKKKKKCYSQNAVILL